MAKETKEKDFKFNISLSVLNHLGRNLYRNFITVIGEAISNSWDADAKNVWITIDREKRLMIVKDDGDGMDETDFQNKFLNIGYSKRNGDKVFNTPRGRAFIGRKGIGKLALLSCSKKVHIGSKIKGGKVIGGVIDNSELDNAIDNNKPVGEYVLQHSILDLTAELKNVKSGTVIVFESITDDIINTIDNIKESIALYFRFSLHDKSFKIFVNDDEITVKHIEKLTNATQLVWNINNSKDPYITTLKSGEKYIEAHEILASDETFKNMFAKKSLIKINGFIATVVEPKNLIIRGTKERATLDLFVNGRLRERDLMKHIPFSRIVENYTYGQIHFDIMDSKQHKKDAFTSSRESVLSDNPLFNEMLFEIKKIYNEILSEWDKARLKLKFDGDPDGDMPKVKRKARELYNQTIKDTFGNTEVKILKKGSRVDEWANEMENDAGFNIPSYAECFIIENVLRKYITHTGKSLTATEQAGARGWKAKEEEQKNNENISFNIRRDENEVNYLSLDALARFIDGSTDSTKPSIERSAKRYKPLRNAVCHTSLLTEDAKNTLTIESNNIKARLTRVLEEFQVSQKQPKQKKAKKNKTYLYNSSLPNS